jgi:multicomponent Na+:H+ antiporter subunit D
MMGAVESDYLIVIIVLCLSTILNVYYLMEIPARAFFLKKDKNINVNVPNLMIIPTMITCFLTIILFFYIEPFKNLTLLMVGK